MKLSPTILAFVAVAAFSASPLAAAPPTMSTIEVHDSMGRPMLRITSTVTRPCARYLYAYEVTNLDYDPDPALANGLSGLHIGIGIALLPEEFTAPLWWSSRLAAFLPPYGIGAQYSLPLAEGPGLAPGETARFSFTSERARGTEWLGSYAFSHTGAGVTSALALVDHVSGEGPIVPAPAPGALTLAAPALVLVLGRGRRRAMWSV